MLKKPMQDNTYPKNSAGSRLLREKKTSPPIPDGFPTDDPLRLAVKS
jgi:hypothetical protein